MADKIKKTIERAEFNPLTDIEIAEQLSQGWKLIYPGSDDEMKFNPEVVGSNTGVTLRYIFEKTDHKEN